MKTRSLLFAVVGALAAASSGCFQGPHGIPGNHRNNEAPIVVAEAPAGLASLDVDITFTAYDPDSDAAILWDQCPYPGGSPILRVGYSVDGGSSFSPIDPADLQLDGAALVVPTCGEVERFDESIRIAVSTSGEQHTFTWSSIDYIPTAADVVFRVAVNDGSFTSEPGDTDEFALANLPSFSVFPEGARPGETLIGAELSGLLTNWDGTTVANSGNNVTVANFVASSTSSATIDITMGPDTDQVLREFTLTTPGAGVPSGDEVASGSLWTCPEIGQPAIEFETEQLGGIAQFICDQGTDWQAMGDLTTGDGDFFQFVAASNGDAAFSLAWAGAGGDVDDYDAYIFDPDVGLSSCDDDLLGCACATVNKPETGTITGMVAGRTYILYISHYAGAELDYTATIGP